MSSSWQLLDLEVTTKFWIWCIQWGKYQPTFSLQISATEMPVEYNFEVMAIIPTFCHLLVWFPCVHGFTSDQETICRFQFFAMTATRGAKLCSTFWDTSAGIVVHITLVESQLHKIQYLKQSDHFLNPDTKLFLIGFALHSSNDGAIGPCVLPVT